MGALNHENEANIFCLHYIFIPRINVSLLKFKSAWNSHQLSTENKSPLQLYTAYSVTSDLFEESVDPSTYGQDPDESYSSDEEYDSVTVPETNIPLSPTSLSQLETQINPNQESDDFGKQLYIDTTQILFQLMTNDGLL